MTNISGSNTVSDGSNGLYTPTTEEMRDAWIEYKCMSECAECPAEFDRWLAQVKAAERERCIEIMDLKSGHYARTHYAGKVCYTCDVFAAIYESS